MNLATKVDWSTPARKWSDSAIKDTERLILGKRSLGMCWRTLVVGQAAAYQNMRQHCSIASAITITTL